MDNPIEQTEMQAVPVPQPVPAPSAVPQVPQLTHVPAIQGINMYFAMGPGSGGPQLYSFDANLKQWRIAQSNEMEQMMLSLGIPANVINAMKNFRM